MRGGEKVVIDMENYNAKAFFKAVVQQLLLQPEDAREYQSVFV